MRLVTISTGFNAPTKHRCLQSVATQPCEHIYIDAFEQYPHPKGPMQNKWEAIAELAPLDIVLELDGDDWLAEGAVQFILDTYTREPHLWLTYGSYRFADGRPGHCEAYPNANYRTERWRASHLKTFRAGLFQKLSPARDLQRADGSWRVHGRDLATMIPMLEMAGPDRIRFIAETLYVYNYASSHEFTSGGVGRIGEMQEVDEVRKLPPYAVLEEI